MPTSNTEELGLFLKCTVIGRGDFGPCACWADVGIPFAPALPRNRGEDSSLRIISLINRILKSIKTVHF